MTGTSRIALALARWDRQQAVKDKHHNRHFLGIACQALEDRDGEDEREIILSAFTGRLRTYLLKQLSLAPMSDTEKRIYR